MPKSKTMKVEQANDVAMDERFGHIPNSTPSQYRQRRFEFFDIKVAERGLLASCLARNR